LPVGCEVGLPLGCEVGLPVGCEVGLPLGCEVGLPVGCEVGLLPGGVASRVAQKDAALSLPPAAVNSAEKAGLSRALPELLPTWAVYAWQSPRSDGDGLEAGWLAGFPLAESEAAALAADLVAAVVPVWFEGKCPVAAARATPPPVTPIAARTMALAASSLVALIDGLRGLEAGLRRAVLNAIAASASPASSRSYAVAAGAAAAAASRLASA
jgi:hypothetical protein